MPYLTVILRIHSLSRRPTLHTLLSDTGAHEHSNCSVREHTNVAVHFKHKHSAAAAAAAAAPLPMKTGIESK